MSRFGSMAMVVGSALAITLSACGETSTPAQAQAQAIRWWPSTPIPTPGAGQSGATPSAQASSTAAAVGQGQANGLGTPAEKISATDALKFDPTATSAKVGDVIQWTNTGSVAHNVTFTDPTLTSGTLQQNNTWQVKITVAGTYMFHCTFHPGMDGQITVTR